MENLKEKLLSILKNSNGVEQSSLPKILGVDRKAIYKVLQELEREGIIRREPFSSGNKKTYKIFITKKEELKIDISDISWSPCAICPDIERCGRGQPISPETCIKLTNALKAEYMNLIGVKTND
ncbi:MAG: MarR family transcriptional regulator [Candidatus Verstraetearchaeota archaeon]|jgi:DNA-binding Lrp family transcriptional regulator|nr:MarR family transcriptional regulator [Candidatus Verstraetearchaeota archaeon]